MRKPDLRLLAAAAALALAGCNLAPTYKLPPVPVASSYQDTADQSSAPWQPAQPSDQLPRDHWWQLYHDARLDQLEQQLLASNADLAAALAHYQQAQAFARQARSGLFPQIGASANGQRDHQSDTKPLRGPLTGPSASPVSPSQMVTDSRWLEMAMAATSAAEGAAARQAEIASQTEAQMRCGSCSTQPGCG